MKKEQKNKVGRPKLADKNLKKKSYIILGISALLLVILISGTLVSLNIMPSTKKLKGSVSCSSIPAHLAYNEQTNPNGFKDIYFYNMVIFSYGYKQTNQWNYSSTEYCNTITEEQLAEVTNLQTYGDNNVTDANGIQYLTGLTSISFNNVPQLGSIDLSHNTALTSLILYSDNINNIDLTHNTLLARLELSTDKLTNIDLSQNAKLTTIRLYVDGLNNIDLSHNTALESLDLSGNNLSSVNLSYNTQLRELMLYGNNLSTLDLSHNTALESLDLSGNNLSTLDLSHNTALTSLTLYTNLSTVDLSHNTALENFYLEDSQLTSIDLSHNTALESLDLSGNNLSSIDLSYNTQLRDLDLSNNQLTDIDLSHNTVLKYLNLENNNLSSIDLSNNDIWQLYLENNKLRKINLSNITYLDDIFNLDNNELHTMYLIKNREEELSIIFPIVSNVSYVIDDDSVVNIKNDKIVGLKTGNTTYTANYTIDKYNNKGTMQFTAYVIDFTSDKYEIDHENKTIDCANSKIDDIKASDFEVSNGTVQIEDNKLKIMIDDNEAFIYELTNLSKNPEKTEENNITNNSSSDNKVDKKVVTTTTKKENTTKKNSNNKKTLTTKTTTKTEKVKEKVKTTTVGSINKVVKKEEVKTNNPIIPIGLGVVGIGLISYIGYLAFIKGKKL